VTAPVSNRGRGGGASSIAPSKYAAGGCN